MSKFQSLIIGGLEITAGILMTIAAVPFGPMLIAMGAGTIIGGLGTMLSQGPLTGTSTTWRNPVAPWSICYGKNCVGGTLIYENSWGDSDKYLDLVIVLAAHPILGLQTLLFDKQQVQIDTSATAPGVPASPPAIGTGGVGSIIMGGSSFSPVQQDVDISWVKRVNDVVTICLVADIPYLQPGDFVVVHDVSVDESINGKWLVQQIIQQTYDPPAPGTCVFTILCGGRAIAQTGTGGQVKTCWSDYRRKVYIEVLTGAQTLGETFQGMAHGTPYDGDTGNLISPGGTGNPWTADCSCVGKAVVFLRLHYNDEVFANGLPQISFVIWGKADILDPRTSQSGYSTNAALCIADFLMNKTWGFKFVLGVDLPVADLIAAANICDESVPLSIGGTEPRYSCNGHFELTMKRGEVLRNLLTCCAGRITYVGGQIKIWPAAWHGPSFPALLAPATPPATGTKTWAVTEADPQGIQPDGSWSLIDWWTDDDVSDLQVGDLVTITGNSSDAMNQADMPVVAIFGAKFPSENKYATIIECSHYTAPGDQLALYGMGGTATATVALTEESSPVVPSAPESSMPLLAGSFRWRPKCLSTDLFNGVKGTYVSQANNWMSSDFPPYAQDNDHGYGALDVPFGDLNLLADGGDRRWLDIQLPFTQSYACAQRLAKIELLRRRQQGTGTFVMTMAAFQMVPLDVIQLTIAFLGWVNKMLEVQSTRFKVVEDQGGKSGPVLCIEVDVQEVSPEIYIWDPREELTPQGFVNGTGAGANVGPSNISGFATESDAATVWIDASAIAHSRILAYWTPVTDGFVLNGGTIQMRMIDLTKTPYSAPSGWDVETQGEWMPPDADWTPLPNIPPTVSSTYITGVVDGDEYWVQIRPVNAGGVPGPWSESFVTVFNIASQLFLVNGQ
ncbi:MAG: hypothetical protein ABSH20_25540 [Tepidisphaeraceae bacterium]